MQVLEAGQQSLSLFPLLTWENKLNGRPHSKMLLQQPLLRLREMPRMKWHLELQSTPKGFYTIPPCLKYTGKVRSSFSNRILELGMPLFSALWDISTWHK